MVEKEHPDYIIATYALTEYIDGHIKLQELQTMRSVFTIVRSMAFASYFAKLAPGADPVA